MFPRRVGADDASTAGKAFRTAPGDDVRNNIPANTTRSGEMTGGSTGITAKKAGDQAVISPADDSQKAGREPRGDGQANTSESEAQATNEGGMKEATSTVGQIHLEVDEQTGRRLSRLSGDSFASEASTATRMDEPTKLTDLSLIHI